MRSSIACSRCRRSKVKCVNSGINTTCRACEASGRECTYPTPVVGANTSSAAGGDGARKPRPKKNPVGPVSGTLAPAGHHGGLRKESPRARRGYAIEDALDPKIVTDKVWKKLFDIFCQNFYPTFPFIHTPSFLDWVKNPPLPASAGAMNPAQQSHSPYVLLGLLTLTARFCEELVANYSGIGQRPDPIGTSEYYASCLRYHLFAPSNSQPSAGTAGVEFGEPSVDKVQALLMLALHEWGAMRRGVQAWNWVGVAMRMADTLGLGVELGQDIEEFYRPENKPPATTAQNTFQAASPTLTSVGLTATPNPLKREWEEGPPSKRRRMDPSKADKESFVEEETRRRTFWSGFMLERSLTGVEGRRSRIRLDDINGREVSNGGVMIRLPCSDEKFFFRNRTQTGTLTYEGLAGGDQADDENVVSKLLKIVEIWGMVQKWAVNPTLRSSQPAQPLAKITEQFINNLPSRLQLTEDNLGAHAMSRSAPPFATLHLTAFLCIIYLYRPHLPLVPLPACQPQPQAAPVFKAAQGILQLVTQLGDSDMQPETPLIGFASYTALLLAIYAKAFPWMDAENVLSAPYQPTPPSQAAKVDTDTPMLSPPMVPAQLPAAAEDMEPMRKNMFLVYHELPKYWPILHPFGRLLKDTYDTYREALEDAGLEVSKSYLEVGKVLKAFFIEKEKPPGMAVPVGAGGQLGQSTQGNTPSEGSKPEAAGWAAINSSASSSTVQNPNPSGGPNPGPTPAATTPGVPPSPSASTTQQQGQGGPAAAPVAPTAAVKAEDMGTASPSPPAEEKIPRAQRIKMEGFWAEDLAVYLRGGGEAGRGWVGVVGS